MLGGGNGDVVSYRLECCVNHNIGCRHGELVVGHGNGVAVGVGHTEALEHVVSVGANSEGHLLTIFGSGGSSNGAMLRRVHCDGVLCLAYNPVHMHVGRRHHKGVAIILSWSEGYVNLGGAFFVSRLQGGNRIASIGTGYESNGFTHGAGAGDSLHKAVVAIDGLFNFYIVFLQLEGCSQNNVAGRHDERLTIGGEEGVACGTVAIEIPISNLVKLIALFGIYCYINLVAKVGCGRSRYRTMVKSFDHSDVIEFFSKCGLDGHVVRWHLKGVEATTYWSGGNSVLSAAHDPGGLQCCNLIARSGGHSQSYLVTHASSSRNLNGAMLNAFGNRDGVGLFSESSLDGHVVGRHLEGV